MITAADDPEVTSGAKEEQSSDGSSQPKLAHRISGGARFASLGGLVLLSNTLMAGKGVVFVVLCVLLLITAVVFADRSEPTARVVEIINALRNHRSDH